MSQRYCLLIIHQGRNCLNIIEWQCNFSLISWSTDLWFRVSEVSGSRHNTELGRSRLDSPVSNESVSISFISLLTFWQLSTVIFLKLFLPITFLSYFLILVPLPWCFLGSYSLLFSLPSSGLVYLHLLIESLYWEGFI